MAEIVQKHATLSIAQEITSLNERLACMPVLIDMWHERSTDEWLDAKISAQRVIIAEAEAEIDSLITQHQKAPVNLARSESELRVTRTRLRLLKNKAACNQLARLYKKLLEETPCGDTTD